MKDKKPNIRLLSKQRTKERRKDMDIKVYDLKFDMSFSKEKHNYLNRIFAEAKWFYNNMITSGSVFEFNYKIKTVEVFNKDREKETRDIIHLSSQMKQAIQERAIGSIKSLSTKKKKGKSNQVGKLKPKREINSIPLKQFDVTYKILGRNRIKIQGFKKTFKIRGFDQIPEKAEFANANLIRKADGYHLYVTCYAPKNKREETGNIVGIDMGIKDQFTLSNGEKYNFLFPETKSIKKLSRKLNKAQKGSNRRYKIQKKLKKANEKLTNKKNDIANKFVSHLKKEYDIIFIQDENLSGWKSSKLKGFGRRVQHGIMGRVKSRLRTSLQTHMISRYEPTTKICPVCGQLKKTSLEDRCYSCECGYSQDRDIHAANNILKIGLNNLKISMDHRNTMLVENLLDKTFSEISIDGKVLLYSMKREAQPFKVG